MKEGATECEQLHLRGGRHCLELEFLSDEVLMQSVSEERLQQLPEGSATKWSEVGWLVAELCQVADPSSNCKQLENKKLGSQMMSGPGCRFLVDVNGSSGLEDIGLEVAPRAPLCRCRRQGALSTRHS